jgi:hypothetical protein
MDFWSLGFRWRQRSQEYLFGGVTLSSSERRQFTGLIVGF